MRTRATAVGTALLCFAAVGTGCGNGGGADEATRQDYIAQSNRICAATKKRAAAAYARIIGTGRPTPDEARRFLARGAVPALRESVARRRELPVPAGDEGEIAAMLAAGERAVAGFKAIAASRTRARRLFLGIEPDPARRYDALSATYGIAECAGGN